MHARLRLLAPALLALGIAGPLAAASGPSDAEAAPAPTVTVRPAALDRGAGPGTPQVLGTRILDGDRRTTVLAQEVQVLGRSGGDYVVAVYRRNGTSAVQRVTPDGTRTTIQDKIEGDVRLSRDGARLFESVPDGGAERSFITVSSARTGRELTRRTFRGYARVLDADGQRVVVGSGSPARTLSWDLATGTTRVLLAQEGYVADLRADRVATFTGDVYAGGCSELAALSAPRTVLWRSCRQAVVAVAPGGGRVLTQSMMIDGPVGQVAVHGQHGRLLATYRSSGAFGPVSFEDARTVLLPTYGPSKAAIVRCLGASCERASGLIDSEY
ncbi:MAG: hypothetical protein ACXVEC_02110 [Nocardioides sp.]